jgi:hypothetical protein
MTGIRSKRMTNVRKMWIGAAGNGQARVGSGLKDRGLRGE